MLGDRVVKVAETVERSHAGQDLKGSSIRGIGAQHAIGQELVGVIKQ
jgi:hypothetical protein